MRFRHTVKSNSWFLRVSSVETHKTNRSGKDRTTTVGALGCVGGVVRLPDGKPVPNRMICTGGRARPSAAANASKSVRELSEIVNSTSDTEATFFNQRVKARPNHGVQLGCRIGMM